MQGRAAARHVVRFDHRERVAGVAPVDTNDHGNSQDVDLLPPSLEWHGPGGLRLASCQFVFIRLGSELDEGETWRRLLCR